MAGRTPREAVDNYLEPIKRSISCIARTYVTVSPRGTDRLDTRHALLINGADPLPLGDAGVSLELQQTYVIVRAEGDRGPYKVSTMGYWYTVRDAADDEEILGYHWHPDGHHIKWPHLHLKHGAGDRRQEFHKAHLPTGRVAIEDVIRLVISDFGVRPMREDWEAVLDESQARFERWRTWGGSSRVAELGSPRPEERL